MALPNLPALSSPKVITTFGFDPALNHGYLTNCGFEFRTDGRPRLYRAETVASWDSDTTFRKSFKEQGVGMLFNMANSITQALSTYGRAPMAVDWDPYSIYYGNTQKLQSVALGFFMGYLSHAAHGVGIPTIFVTPAQVRKKLSIPGSNAPKKLVQSMFLERVEIPATVFPSRNQAEDWMDSVILAYILAHTLLIEELNHVQSVPSSDLPSGGDQASDPA